ncbi:hypothetical protein SAMN04488540_10168 [Ferrimonas sediminum]|uniref:Uncharacterized protein n=1 Tax=Ferrimonas sediminum TaxID=718193 RepID=A0A1G8JIV8_9GAMM|nr:hypothetical protein SAMN04488540_10168 [Ferrimonas sediminum]
MLITDYYRSVNRYGLKFFATRVERGLGTATESVEEAREPKAFGQQRERGHQSYRGMGFMVVVRKEMAELRQLITLNLYLVISGTQGRFSSLGHLCFGFI